MTDLAALEAAAVARLRDLDSRLPPVTIHRFRLRMFKNLDELSASVKAGDRDRAVNDLVYLAARCRLFAEGLRKTGGGRDDG